MKKQLFQIITTGFLLMPLMGQGQTLGEKWTPKNGDEKVLTKNGWEVWERKEVIGKQRFVTNKKEKQVVAIGWKTAVLPKMKTLLGSYHQDFIKGQSDQAFRNNKTLLQIETKRLTLVSKGKLRAFQGYAWISQKKVDETVLNEIKKFN